MKTLFRKRSNVAKHLGVYTEIDIERKTIFIGKGKFRIALNELEARSLLKMLNHQIQLLGKRQVRQKKYSESDVVKECINAFFNSFVQPASRDIGASAQK